MSRYDGIGIQYDGIKTTSSSRLEQFNFRKHVEPFLQEPNTTVIDFACGTGFYSHLLLSWDAASLTGIDISHTILAGAVARLSATPFASSACFFQGDAFEPQCYPVAGSEGFDVATGVWFLNYADDLEQLTCMFRSISINLKRTGVFVGICPCPKNDVALLATKSDPPPPTGVRVEYSQKLENRLGYRLHVVVEPPPSSNSSAQGVDFWCYHLNKSVFEKAARLGGMGGKLEWRECESLEEKWKLALGMTNEEEWQNLRNNPQM